jgi:hypothetical protein
VQFYLTFNLPANANYSLVVFVAGVGSGSFGWARVILLILAGVFVLVLSEALRFGG